MRRSRVLLVHLPLSVALGLFAIAKAQRWDWDDEATAAQLRAFDVFLHDHPWNAEKLWDQVSRVNDKDFVSDNKELKQWLQDHPGAAEAFRENPRGFMERERSFQLYGEDFDSGDAARSQLARFDWFLDGHPNIRHDLMKRPGLVNNEDYLESHPALHDFLQSHPGTRAELRDHPKEFMQREARYERTE